jgi:hypothetical protein
MSWEKAPILPAGARGTRLALIFALVAERLSAYYEHGEWLSSAHGARLCGDWLARSQRTLPLDERRKLSQLSDEMARAIESELSREAGLYTAHEMMEALDPNYSSELAPTLMAECERRLDAADAADAAP